MALPTRKRHRTIRILPIQRKRRTNKNLRTPILKKGQGDLEKIVFVLKGSQLLSLLVQTDDFARYGGFRFGIYASYGQSDVAGVVVGVRDNHTTEN
jgi:hypothetical protein